MDEFAERMRRVDVELAAIENAAMHVNRIRMTPPVDDDFPQVKYEYDQSVRTLVDALRVNGRI
jgi:hypothetical protein